ncbi:MAG: hypothetical protein ABI438_04010 [Dermatophilaceae bacterium]
MKFAPRAVVSVLMLSGVLALGAAAVLAVSTAVVMAAGMRGAWAVLAAIIITAVIFVLVMVVPAAKRRQHKPVEGVLVTDDEQPLLWVEILIVAEGLHMWPPRQLVLAPDASVIASESRTWLGLRPGVRRLQLGEVLLAGLTERQLRAVMAHELLRFWGPSRTARFIHRGRKVTARVLDAVGEDSRAGRMVGRFGRMYVRVSDPVIRGHELDADTRSANLVGNGATAAALREVAVLSKGWDAFVDGYLEPSLAARRRPADVFASFTEFLEHPDRRVQLAKAIGAAAPLPLATYSAQPSLADRLAAVASLPEDNTQDRSGRALDMLREPEREIERLHEWMFRDHPDLIVATWEEIVPAAGRAAAREGARALVRLGQLGELGPTLSVGTQLDIIRFGLAEEMVRPLFEEPVALEVERHVASRLVTSFLTTAAIGAGTASHRFSWATPLQLVDAQGGAEDLAGLVDAALADPDQLVAVEKWLRTHKVAVDVKLDDSDEPDPDLVRPLVLGPDPAQERRVPEASPVTPSPSTPAKTAERSPERTPEDTPEDLPEATVGGLSKARLAMMVGQR